MELIAFGFLAKMNAYYVNMSQQKTDTEPSSDDTQEGINNTLLLGIWIKVSSKSKRRQAWDLGVNVTHQ